MAAEDYEFYEGRNRCMGTLVKLYAFHPPGKREWMLKLADRFFDSLEEDDRRLSIFAEDSLINRINRAAGKEAVVVDRSTFELLVAARRYWELTGGLFDITAGVLMRSYGYYGDASLPESPRAGEFRELRALVGCDKLELDADNLTARLAAAGMLIDLGGLAKGWCVEKRARILLDEGLEDFVISAGTSTVLARGSAPQSEGWPMELENPKGDNAPGREMVLTDCAVSVSGNYRNTRSGPDGSTVRHIMNPLTLQPVEEVRQVVVVGPEATECEALSTAFLIQGGPRGTFSLENRPDITVYFERKI